MYQQLLQKESLGYENQGTLEKFHKVQIQYQAMSEVKFHPNHTTSLQQQHL